MVGGKSAGPSTFKSMRGSLEKSMWLQPAEMFKYVKEGGREQCKLFVSLSKVSFVREDGSLLTGSWTNVSNV
jgi:hypothetical protein